MPKVHRTYCAFFKRPASERGRAFVYCLLALAGGLCSASETGAQALTARLTVVSLAPATVRIEGDWRRPADKLSFLNTYGKLIGLAERIEHLTVKDSLGNLVAIRRTSAAEFQSERPASHFAYDVSVSEPLKPADGPHVSWLNAHFGYLMLADLLPAGIDEYESLGVQLEFQLPSSWGIASVVQPNRRGQYQVASPAQAVFFVGSDLQLQRKQIGGTDFLFATVGQWPFPSGAVTDIAARIMKDHAQHVGVGLRGRTVLMLSPFPGTVGAEQWSAETRGSNVVLLLGRNSPRDVLLGRLSVVLTHELFHLWVPNRLSFAGDYDWFFEGFTLYQALRSAVRLGFIDFQEYLSTMARVYDSYLGATERDRLSLVEASERRWLNGSSLVYDQGMLVAFLCDLELRRSSRNRRSLDNVYRELFRQPHLDVTRADGNASLVDLLNHEQGSEQFTRRYILTPTAIRLETELSAYGLMVESSDTRRQLQVIQPLSNEQNQLLRSLGYKKPR